MGTKVRCPGCQRLFTASPPEENIQPAEEVEVVEVRPSRPTRSLAPEPEEVGEVEPPPRRRGSRRGRVGQPHRGGLMLTLGILTVVFGLCCPLICWIIGGFGLVMAIMDLGKMARRQMDRSGRGMTKTGMILAIVGLVIGVINGILGLALQLSK
jgi:hypothetical protein